MNIIVVSGGFDPIHSGHISYLSEAKANGDMLIVALNSDDWLLKKKGKFFMPFRERKIILENITFVDHVIDFEDDDKGSAADALEKVKKKFPEAKVFFANGGDRNISNIPEMSVSGIEFLFGVGGELKLNSSSDILKNWKYSHEIRKWGSFYNLFEDKNCKVKELIVSSGEGMSFQKHFTRSEIWLVRKGSCVVNYSKKDPQKRKSLTLNQFDQYNVPQGEWHQITNPFKEKCYIIEIQYGEACHEEDIERVDYYKS